MPPPGSDPPASDRLGDRVRAMLGDAYHIERELPPGGMSRLFLATERSLDRKVVVKVLPPEFTSEVSAARFQREVTVAAHLQHPHILPVLTAGSRDGLLFYITPYVEGESLRQRLRREGRLPVGDAVRILTETADALARANKAGVVHRDIKPENILLQDGHALLADFGVARALDEVSTGGPGAAGQQRLTETGMAPGTPGYMAPEQLAGERDVDARADVYALAVVGYEMLAGASPFVGPTPQAVAASHFGPPPRSLVQIRPDVPRGVSDAIDRALAKEPDARFASAANFRDALSPSAPAARQRRWGALAIGMATVAALLAVSAVVMRGRHRGPAAPDANLIAVEPFTVLDPALAVWREGMVDVLSHNFDNAGPLRTVPPTVVVHRAHDASATAPDLARSLGAGLAITGSVERSGADSVRVSATLLNVPSGRSGDEIVVRGPADHMDWVTDSVTVGILRSLARTQPVGAARGSLAGAKSLPALKALLEAEQALRHGGWDSAQRAAETAIRLDSTFALAYYWAAFAVGWREGADSLAVRYSLRAQTYNRGLSPRDSLLIATNALLDSYNSSHLAEGQQMFALAAAGVQRYPDDPQIWNNLGEVRMHAGLGPRLGVSGRSVLDALNHAIALDSSFAPAYVHAITLAFAVMGQDSGLKYARRFLALNPPSVDGKATRLQMLLLGRPRDTAAAHQLADSASPEAITRAIRNMMVVSDSAESAVWLARSYVRRMGPMWPGLGPPPASYAGNASFYRGHVRGTWSFALHLVPPIPAGPLATLAAAGQLGAIPTAALDSVLRIPSNMLMGWSWYGLRWWAERGDTADLQRYLDARASRKTFDPTRDVHPPAYDTAVTRGYLWLARHDTAAAMRRFSELPDTLCGSSCLLDVITRAELLTSHGRAAAADSLLQRRYAPDGPMIIELLQQLALARAAEKAGDRTTAVDSYARIEDAWAGGDPEVQPAVREARAALTRLGSDRK